MIKPTAVKLTAELIEIFSEKYLLQGFDEPCPIPEFHREGWKLYSSDARNAAIVAPRDHAKSTAFTHVFTLITVLMRIEPYVVLVGASEELAAEALGDIARELRENDGLIRKFGISKFITDSKMDIIVEFNDGYQFRIIARGSGQRMRGRKWRSKRPGLVILDDIENDTNVESAEQRRKLKRWFLRVVIPMLRKGGKIRIHGTILHAESLLSGFIKDKSYKTLFYKAHQSFDDFSNMLWPEKFDESYLRQTRDTFIAQSDAAGYAQEYLNDPLDHSDAYLKSEDFIDMGISDIEKPKRKCIGVDFAATANARSNRTSFTVGGMDAQNFLHIIGQVVGKYESPEVIEIFFSLNELHDPEYFFVENGQIWAIMKPIIDQEMQKRGVFMNFMPINSSKSKAVRGRSLQKRMTSHAVKFNKKECWYPAYEQEMLSFSENYEAGLDDQFDSTTILSIGFDRIALSDPEDFMNEEEMYLLGHGRLKTGDNDGRSEITGY